MATQTLTSPSNLSDSELLAEVTRLAARERHATAALIASLAELDARRLYLAEGRSSLFTYCTRVLHLSEHAAYGRIEAARAARRFPIILDLLTDGSVNLTTIGLLAPHLTDGNHQQVFASARRKSKREVEHIVAGLRPQPDVASAVRKLPSPKQPEVAPEPVNRNIECVAESQAPSVDAPPDRPAVVRPLAPERYKVQFTVSRATYEKLRRAQDLMRHTVPNGDPAIIFDRALTALLEDLERTKVAATSRPRRVRPSARASRHIPSAVKREVWRRDGGRCAFVGTHGRCAETGFLEFHHVRPFAEGGPATVENIELRCRAHNAYEAGQQFGTLLVREEGRVMFGDDSELGPDRALRLTRSGVPRDNSRRPELEEYTPTQGGACRPRALPNMWDPWHRRVGRRVAEIPGPLRNVRNVHNHAGARHRFCHGMDPRRSRDTVADRSTFALSEARRG